MLPDYLLDHVLTQNMVNNEMNATLRQQQLDLIIGPMYRKLNQYQSLLENAQPQAVLHTESTMKLHQWHQWLGVGLLPKPSCLLTLWPDVTDSISSFSRTCTASGAGSSKASSCLSAFPETEVR